MALSRGSVFAGDYQIIDDKPLSEGGMGAVYRVEQISTGKRRALKVMHAPLVADERLRERFVQEARVGGRIESAHVVDVLSAGIDDATGMPWLAMELLEGVDLGRRIDEQGPFSQSEALEVLEQLCHAVGAAHGAGIVHRDLKPENIFLARSKEASGRSVVKVLDFGIAKIVAEAVTKRTGAMGTPLWMAPEQTETGTVDETADVWALGLITFYVLTGRCFWKTGNNTEVSIPQIMREVIFEPIPAASLRALQLGRDAKIPMGFDPWFARCVTRERSERFPNATAMFRALQGVLSPGRTPIAPTVVDDRADAAPVTDPIPTNPRGSRSPAHDRTVLATSPSAPPPVAQLTSMHPPTPAPNELPPRPAAAARSPAIIIAALLGVILALALLVVLIRAGHSARVASGADAAADADVPLVVLASAAPSAEEVAPVAPLASGTSLAAPQHPPHLPSSASAKPNLAGTDPLPRSENPKLEEVVPVPSDVAVLNLTCFPPAHVTVDGQSAGFTPRKGFRVSPGAHSIVFVVDGERKRSLKVHLTPGEIRTVSCNVRERSPSD